MAINDTLKHIKYKAAGVAAAGIILGSSILGCSSGSNGGVPSNYDAAAAQTEIYNIIQKQPQIQGVMKYKLMPTQGKGIQVIGAEFTIDGIEYDVYTAPDLKSLLEGTPILDEVDIVRDDGKQVITTKDWGNESSIVPRNGDLDGKVDSGQTGTNPDKEYDRYKGLNTGLRDGYQEIHNDSLERILNFFKQR